jgi:Domain of unknown function (DUF6468)
MTLLVVLDVMVGALLVATIGYCVVLNRKLAALRRNEAELREVLTQFAAAARQAEAGVALLKKAGREAASSLTDQIGEAKALRDDLAFVTGRGDRLVADLSKRMEQPKSPPRPMPAVGAQTAPALSRAERELAAALDGLR